MLRPVGIQGVKPSAPDAGGGGRRADIGALYSVPVYANYKEIFRSPVGTHAHVKD